MLIAIAGGRDQADFLVGALLAKKHRLVVINEDLEYCEYLSKKYDTVIIHGDPTRIKVLEDAEIREFDVLIALMALDADNLAVCQWARKSLKVQKTVCTVTNPNNVDVFKKMGVNVVISSTYMVADHIAKSSTIENLIQSLSIENAQMLIYEVSIGSDHPFVNKLIKDIKIPHEVIIGCIFRQTRLIVPHGLTEIKPGDKLLILSTLPETDIPDSISGAKGR